MVVMLQIKTCDGSFFRCTRWEKNENFLFDFPIYFDFLISFEVNELSSQIDEVEKFGVIVNVSNEISPGPVSCTVPSWPKYTVCSVIVTAAVQNIEVVEVILIIVLQCEVKNYVPDSYPFVALKGIQWDRGYAHC